MNTETLVHFKLQGVKIRGHYFVLSVFCPVDCFSKDLVKAWVLPI